MDDNKIIEWMIAGIAGSVLAVMGFLAKREIRSYDTRIDKVEKSVAVCAKKSDVDGLSVSVAALTRQVSQCATHDDINALRSKELRVLESDIKNLGEKFSKVVRDEMQQMRHDQNESARLQNERFDRLFAILIERNSGV